MKLKFWNSFPKLIVKPFSTAEGSIFLQSYGLIAIWWKHLEWNKIIANIILFALIRSLINELTLTIGRVCVFDWRSNYWQKPEFPDLNRSGWTTLIEHAKYYLIKITTAFNDFFLGIWKIENIFSKYPQVI